MKNFLARLSSRKFLLTVAAFLTFIANEQYHEAIAAILGFVFMEGTADALQVRHSVPVSLEDDMSQNDVDTSKVVTGTGRLTAFDEES